MAVMTELDVARIDNRRLREEVGNLRRDKRHLEQELAAVRSHAARLSAQVERRSRWWRR